MDDALNHIGSYDVSGLYPNPSFCLQPSDLKLKRTKSDTGFPLILDSTIF